MLCLLLLCGLPLCAGHAEFVFGSDEPAVDAAPEWTYPIPLEVLEDPDDVLRLINRENLLGRKYPDQSLAMYKLVDVTLPVTKGSHQLRPITVEALTAMFTAAEADGIKLYVGSAYRNYRTQEVIHYNYVRDRGHDDGLKLPGGASEHQSGLAADVVSWAYRDGFTNSFASTPEGQWLAANCARFGFILRYPKDKTDITGVPYESWHIRYVGVEVAEYITEAGLTLEEFTAEWQAAMAAYNSEEPPTEGPAGLTFSN